MVYPSLPALGACVQRAWREGVARREAWPAAEREAWEAARRELLAVARDETGRGDDVSVLSADPAAPVLVTGHQPELYHPGVWVKGFVVDAVCRAAGVVGVNLTVDADLASRVVDVPAFTSDGRWWRSRVILPGIRAGLPWSSQPPLDHAAWRALFDALRRSLVPSLHGVLGDFVACALKARGVREARTLAESLLWARRAWEGEHGPPRYLELPVSAMCDTVAFHAFAASLLSRMPDFWQAYNACLADYRRRQHVRTGAHPMPDLRRRDALWEAPFWCLHPDGTRAGLFIEREMAGWRVRSRDASFGRLEDAAVDAWPHDLRAMLARGGAALRPRAITLTMFTRRVLADVFVHGVGGARYERVGDAVAARFFRDASAPWAVASATLCVSTHDGTDATEGVESARVVGQQLRDLHYNPQRFALSNDATAARKRTLVAAIALASGDEKRRLNRALDEVDDDLRVRLAPARAALVERLAAAEVADASRAALHWRGYPFVLFRPARLRGLVADALDRADGAPPY